MKIIKRILAIVLVLIMVAMYFVTFYFAITDNPNTMTYFKASIFLTFAIPVFIYAVLLVKKVFTVPDTVNKQ